MSRVIFRSNFIFSSAVIGLFLGVVWLGQRVAELPLKSPNQKIDLDEDPLFEKLIWSDEFNSKTGMIENLSCFERTVIWTA